MRAQVAPERTVKDNVVTSLRDPPARIELPGWFEYVGADRWVLLDIADCELHAFVKSGAGHEVQRLGWVQFEQYIPTRPELHHTYDSPRHATISGVDFYVDTWVSNPEGKTKPGSDWEHIKALITRHGYTIGEMMFVRLVHLLDDAKRKELMIIYAEDLKPTGFTAADLRDGGRAHDRWPQIEEELIERARKAIALSQ
jgi:hypothetical protein